MTAKTLSCCLLFAVAGSLFTGCTQFESVKDRFATMPPKTRVVQGQTRQVYDATRLVMERLGYAFVGGGPAQGRLEGLSRIATGDSFGAARQRSISIHLQPLEGGSVEVQVLLKETVERDADRSSGTATELSVREPAAYEDFFDRLEQLLKTGKAG